MKTSTLLLIGCPVLLLACGGETAGRVVEIEVQLRPEADPDRTLGEFTTDTGWEVSLTEARLAVSALYAFAPVEERSVMARLSDLLVPVARAHGGFDPASGLRARAELLEPLVIDLLDDEGQAVPDVDAEAGEVKKVVLEIAKPGAEVPAELHGHQAWVAGEARRGDELVRFEGGLHIPDEGVSRRIEVAPDDIALDEGGTLLLSIRLSRWLHDASFERLAPAAEDGEPAEITPESQVGRAFFIGARSPAAISVQYEP